MIEGLKPYTAYKDSGQEWLGQIPAHWELKTGHAAYAERHEPNTGLKENTVLSLSYGRIKVKPVEKQHGLVPKSYETYQVVDAGNIIIRGTDMQNDHTSLRVGLSGHRGIISSAYICLQTRRAVVPAYGYQLLNTFDTTKAIYRYGSGLRQNLSYDEVRRLPIFLPQIDEQTAIVRFLDHANRKIDGFIRAKRRLIALLGEQKQAIIHKAVTIGVGSDTEVRSSTSFWFPRIPQSWDIVTMGRVVHSAVDGPHFSPNYLGSGIPFLSARNIRTDRWLLGDAKFISKADYKEFCRRVRPEIGDVLYTKGGTTGVAKVVDLDFPFQVWVHIAVLKLNHKLITPGFLAFCLNSPRCYEQSQLFTRGATNQDLGLGRMKQIELPLPPSLEEQSQIVEWLNARLATFNDAAIRTEREIALMQEYRTRLTTDVVTGKLDVREAAAKLPDLPADAIEPARLESEDEVLEELEPGEPAD